MGYEQLFHVYEANDYQQIPSFITTDVYLQAYHMYFSYALKSLERNHFNPALQKIVQALYTECMNLEQQETIKAEAGYAATYFAIAYYLLTKKELPVPVALQPAYKAELRSTTGCQDAPSAFLGYTDILFPLQFVQTSRPLRPQRKRPLLFPVYDVVADGLLLPRDPGNPVARGYNSRCAEPYPG